MADGTEGINFKVTIHGKTNRQPSNLTPLTLRHLLKWIDEKPTLSDSLKEELKKMASTYPQQALPKWQAAFAKHLAKARAALSKRDMFINTIEPIKEEENGKKSSGFDDADLDEFEEFNTLDGQQTD